MTWTGWSLVGVGAASLVTGIILGARAQSKAGAVEDAYALGAYDWSAIKPFEDDGKALQTGQIITLVVGGIAATGGAVLLLLAPSAERKTSASISPIISADTVGLAGSVRF
jgi:predicted metal-binding membrane protein